MFFDMDLLCRQRQGKFGLIWLAATRGIRSLRKRDVDRVNIINICNELLKYIMSQSTSPKKRLSLYLSSKLIFGTVLIYRQQIVNFQDTITTLYISIKKPLVSIDCEDTDKAPKKKSKITKKSKQLDVVTTTQAEQIRVIALQYEQALPDLNSNIIDSIHITLPEEVSGRLEAVNANLFGDEGQIDQQLSQLCGDNWMNIPDVPIPPAIVNLEPLTVSPQIDQAPEPITVQDIVPTAQLATPRKSKRLVGSPEESPTKRKRIAAKDELATTERREGDAVRMEVEAQVYAAPQSPVRELEVQPAPVADETLMPPPRRRPPVRRHLNLRNVNINVDSPSKWQRTRLDRPVVNVENMLRSPARVARDNDPKELIALILAGVQYDDEDIARIVPRAGDNISTESIRTNLTTVDNILGRTIEPIVEQDVQIQEVEVLATLPEQQVEVPLPMQIDEIQTVSSPRLSKILRDDEVAANISDIPLPRLHASTPKPSVSRFETAVTRQHNLMNIIRSFFLETECLSIHLDQLSEIHTRPSMANIFCDLLYLHGVEFIRMESAPGSVELQNIYRGEKYNL